MFIETADAHELRQGDILQGFYYPKFSCRSLPVLGVASPDAGPRAAGLSLTASVRSQSGSSRCS